MFKEWEKIHSNSLYVLMKSRDNIKMVVAPAVLRRIARARRGFKCRAMPGKQGLCMVNFLKELKILFFGVNFNVEKERVFLHSIFLFHIFNWLFEICKILISKSLPWNYLAFWVQTFVLIRTGNWRILNQSFTFLIQTVRILSAQCDSQWRTSHYESFVTS